MVDQVDLKDIKNWNVDIEREITRSWRDAERFLVSPGTQKKIYSIDTPPPYVNSPIHIAQAVTYCYMDFFARYKRMKGFEVIFPLGLDRNGLPIEVATEKKFKVSPFKVSREEFIAKCEELINEGSEGTMQSFAELGISFTSYKEGDHLGAVYKTDSPQYRAVTQSTFIELYKKGLVYEADYLTNWDPKLRTSIADSEIERREQETDLNYLKFKLVDSDEYLVIATTRPELLCTSAVVLYNPKDDRYKKFKDRKVITPFFGTEVPVIEHADADPDFGSGLVFMSKSAGDQDAVRFLREMGIIPVSCVGMDGRMNEHAGPLQGLKTRQAREKVIEEIKKLDLMEKQEKLMHSVPISERSKAEIEFVAMREFYLNQLDFVDDIKKISKQIKFYPEESRQILNRWLDSVSIDWPISRRRFYATPIPLWQSGDLTAVPPAGQYYIPWKQSPPKDALVFEDGKDTGKTVADYADSEWVGETRVFDTWMDSSISELVLLKYQEDPDFFAKAFPASLRPQGKEIVRTWLYYTILRGFLETGKACFEGAWIHQHLTDAHGKKMSKSKGNVIDPKDLVKQHGAEAIRMWASTEGNLAKNDLKVSPERIQSEKKTLNKLLNVAKFVDLFEKPEGKPEKLLALDQLFVDYINHIALETDSFFAEYDFYNPMVKLREFLWDTFASHYLEVVKPRAYNQDNKFSQAESGSARYALHYVLDVFLHLVYPVIPQVTTTIASARGFDLLSASFPSGAFEEQDFSLVDKIKDFNASVWKEKKDKGISLKESISGISVPEELVPFASDLKVCHNLK